MAINANFWQIPSELNAKLTIYNVHSKQTKNARFGRSVLCHPKDIVAVVGRHQYLII